MTSNPSSPSLRPKPLDALVAAAVIALTVVTALLFYAPKTGAGQLTAVITQHGQTVRTVPLTSLDKELVIPLDDGNYHLTVHVDGTGVYVADSDCPGPRSTATATGGSWRIWRYTRCCTCWATTTWTRDRKRRGCGRGRRPSWPSEQP